MDFMLIAISFMAVEKLEKSIMRNFSWRKDEGDIKGDPSGTRIYKSILEDICLAALYLYVDLLPQKGSGPRTFVMQSQVITVGSKGDDRYPYPATENWQKAIGGHHIWVTADVAVESIENVRKFNIESTIHMEDMYNFNPGEEDVGTKLPDKENGIFEETWLAHEYLCVGEVKVSISCVAPQEMSYAYDLSDFYKTIIAKPKGNCKW